MNQTFEQRIQSIENELKEIRKELEESLARYNTSYKQNHYPFTNGDISQFRSGVIGDIPQYEISTYYRKGSVVKWADGVEMKAKCNTVGSTSDWYDPTKYNDHGCLLEL